jgi:hypothetical protein
MSSRITASLLAPFLLMMLISSASAQVQRTFVSGGGSDSGDRRHQPLYGCIVWQVLLCLDSKIIGLEVIPGSCQFLNARDGAPGPSHMGIVKI